MTITYEESERVDLRLGTIIEVKELSKIKKPVYGQILVTLLVYYRHQHKYTPNSLSNKQVIGCINLCQRNIAGFKSQFLLTGFTIVEQFA